MVPELRDQIRFGACLKSQDQKGFLMNVYG